MRYLTNFYNLFNPVTINHRILLWMLFVTTFPLLISNLLGLQAAITLVKNQSLQRMEVLAAQKIDRIEELLSDDIQSMGTFSENPVIINTIDYLNNYYYKGISTLESENKEIINTAEHLKSFRKHHLHVYDMFIVTKQGDIALSLAHEDAIDTNLQSGKYRDTGIGKVFSLSKNNKDLAISGFNFYLPSKQEAIFFAKSVYKNEQWIGTVIMQLNPKELYSIISDHSGLAETGETILAKRDGQDALLIAPRRFNSDAAFKQRVYFQKEKNKPIIHALKGYDNSGIYYDHRNEEVLAAWGFIEAYGWGLVVKIDTKEAFLAIKSLKQQYLLILLVTLLMVLIISVFLAQSLSKPISALNHSVKKVLKQGWREGKNFTVSIDDRTELGTLADSFNTLMLESSHNEQQKKIFDAEREKLNKTLDTIISNATDGILCINENQEILFFNPEAERLFGYSAKEVIGKSMTMLMPEYARKHHQKNVHYFRDVAEKFMEQKGANRNLMFQGMHKDGHIFPAAVGISRTQLSDCSWTFTAFIRDVTEQKAIEVELKKSKEQAEEANRAKTIFLTNMSHELRTPMHAILSFAQMGIKRIDKVTLSKLERYYQNIDTSAQRLLVLLNDLLDLSKLEAGRMELNISEHNFDTIVQACHMELDAKLKEQKLDLFINKPNTSTIVSCDELRIHQVIINLLSNAIKFSPNETDITIEYFVTERQYLEFRIIDRGIGIDPNNLEKYFDKFMNEKRNENTTDMGSTGLGLAICKEIIELHQGKIWAESYADTGKDTNNRQKTGGVFCFTIPLITVASTN